MDGRSEPVNAHHDGLVMPVDNLPPGGRVDNVHAVSAFILFLGIRRFSAGSMFARGATVLERQTSPWHNGL